MPKRLNKNKYTFKTSPLYLVGFLVLFLALVASVYALLKPSTQIEPQISYLYHGPHIGPSLGDSSTVLGTSTNSTRRNRYTRPTTSPSPKPTATPLPVSSSTPSPSTSTSPTPTPISTGSLNHWGVAAGGGLTGLTQAQLDTYFGQLKELGVSWIRWDFDWGDIQASGSQQFDWLSTDRVQNTANKYGIKTLGIITYTPEWAQKSICRGSFACAPNDANAFGIFAAEVARRYSPMGVHTWEIWNEQNLGQSWKPAANVAEYAAVLKAAYQSIKQVDSTAFIMSGGLSAAGDGGANISPATFMKSLYATDTTHNFDAVALHPYSYPVVASYVAPWNSWQQIAAVRQIMVNNGDSGKSIWVTEYGSPTGGPGRVRLTTDLDFVYGSDFMSESAESQIMQDVLTQALSIKSYLGGFFWYSLKDLSTNTATPENFFGLLRPDGSKKPAYSFYQQAIVANP